MKELRITLITNMKELNYKYNRYHDDSSTDRMWTVISQ